jgi:hypothetical protein
VAPSLLDTFRALASFSPPRTDLSQAPWEQYVDWAIAQGLAPLAAYNLEFRLGGAGAPDWARDRLLSLYQGAANDNVMKLVNFKRSVDELEGRQVVLLGAASFAEALYPHVAFRPVLDIEVMVPPMDVDPFANFLRAAEFKPHEAPSQLGADRVVTDGRTEIAIHGRLLGAAHAQEETAMRKRALPLRVFGPSFFRLDLEDAILAHCLEQARHGYEVPVLSYLDLRELLRGAPDVNGPYSRPFDAGALHARAKTLRLSRALYCSVSIAERLFPELADVASRARPTISKTSRLFLNRAVIEPASQIGRMTTVRGSDRLRRLLAGGR